jgi:hypothetical protein
MPTSGALARRRADHRCPPNGRRARPLPALRRRRASDRHRLCRRRRRLGVHESVGRPRDQRRHDPRATTAQGRARASRRSPRLRTDVARLHGGRRAAVLSQPDRGRPSAARRDERDPARHRAAPTERTDDATDRRRGLGPRRVPGLDRDGAMPRIATGRFPAARHDRDARAPRRRATRPCPDREQLLSLLA